MDPRELQKIERLKTAALLDVLRRVIANPHNAEDVARGLAQDWFPLMKVDEQGNVSFAVYGYNDVRADIKSEDRK